MRPTAVSRMPGHRMPELPIRDLGREPRIRGLRRTPVWTRELPMDPRPSDLCVAGNAPRETSCAEASVIPREQAAPRATPMLARKTGKPRATPKGSVRS